MCVCVWGREGGRGEGGEREGKERRKRDIKRRRRKEETILHCALDVYMYLGI